MATELVAQSSAHVGSGEGMEEKSAEREGGGAKAELTRTRALTTRSILNRVEQRAGQASESHCWLDGAAAQSANAGLDDFFRRPMRWTGSCSPPPYLSQKLALIPYRKCLHYASGHSKRVIIHTNNLKSDIHTTSS
jgi:hypothetical protein